MNTNFKGKTDSPQTGSKIDFNLSVVIPCYNEASVIGVNAQQVLDYLHEHFRQFELVFVNDGSSDNTLEELNKLAETDTSIKVLSDSQNRGKGYAIKQGLLGCTGQGALFMDADLSTPISELELFLEKITEGQDIIIGTRKGSTSRVEKPQNFLRTFMGKGFSFLSNFLVKDISDMTCGFKYFNRKAIDAIFPKQRIFNWSYDTEILHIAQQHKLSILEVPVRWINHEDSKVNILRDTLSSLSGLVRIKYHSLAGHYV